MGGYFMFCNKIIFSLFSVFLLSGCGGGRDEKLNVEVPKTTVAMNQNTKAFYATKNPGGTYTTFIGSWVVPPHVKSVKITGCSGGNGGGGGGAGGAGAKFYTGNWAGASWGGNGSSGGYANGVNGSGGVGQGGALGQYRDGGGPWFNAVHSHGGYPQASSATQPGDAGSIGAQTIFGKYTFSNAFENKNNLNNILKLKSLIDFDEVCLGGAGGAGGAGGIGGTAETDLGNESTRYYVGGTGGRGGNGQVGFHALVEEVRIDVTPGETLQVQVGQGGNAGNRSGQIVSGQSGSFGSNGQNGSLGSSGESGKPGALYLQWIGL
jgi:hypothetical protein